MTGGVGQDVRYALRLLRRDTVFAGTAVLSLAIGLGANTALASVASALLLRSPSGVTEPDRLIDIGSTHGGRGFNEHAYLAYVAIRERAAVFAGVYAYTMEPDAMSLRGADLAVGSAGVPDIVRGSLVSTNYFVALGTRPQVGRLFDGRDSEQPGASPVLVLSDRVWRRQFGADPAIVGQALELNGHRFDVVGVASEGFQGTTILAPDLWVPIGAIAQAVPSRADWLQLPRGSSWLTMGARLAPGVTLPQAQADLDRVAAQLRTEFPAEYAERGLRGEPSASVPGNALPAAGLIGLVMALVTLVLAVACTNVAGVQLSRMTARTREFALRAAAGAGRGRLVRQVLVESLVLFALGSIAGVAVARLLASALTAAAARLPVPVRLELALDWRVAVFAAALALAAAVLSGLAPALTPSRRGVVAAIRAGSAGTERQRLRAGLLVAQIACSIVLVVLGGLFVRALHAAGDADVGFDPNGLELARIDFSLAGYTSASGPAAVHALVEGVRGIPGVQAASAAVMLPLSQNRMTLGGLSIPSASPRWVEPDWNVVEPDYFRTMRIPLAQGREFTDADRMGSPRVVIVNARAAREWWPGVDPIGRTVVRPTGSPSRPGPREALTVIGVARDTAGERLGAPAAPLVFIPLQQRYMPAVTVVVRTSGPRVAAEIQRAAAEVSRSLPVVRTTSFEAHAALGLLPQRIAAGVAGSLGLLGLVLAAIGVYGVAAQLVARRRREIGIRVALGADAGAVAGLVVRHVGGLAAAGTVVGLGLAAMVSRLVTALLFGVGPIDPIVFAGSAALFVIVSLAACGEPARGATAIAPLEALRHE